MNDGFNDFLTFYDREPQTHRTSVSPDLGFTATAVALHTTDKIILRDIRGQERFEYNEGIFFVLSKRIKDLIIFYADANRKCAN